MITFGLAGLGLLGHGSGGVIVIHCPLRFGAEYLDRDQDSYERSC